MLDELVDPDAMAAMQQVAQALIEFTPQHFRIAFCIVESCPRHASGRLIYKIGSPDHPSESTNRPSPELHDAVHALYRVWTRDNQPFPGIEARVEQLEDGTFKSSVKQLDMAEAPRTAAGEESLWQSAYDARVKFFEGRFGPLPGEIQKLLNLTGVWPGGGLFQLETQEGRGVVTSFGLSNADMPARARSTSAEPAPDAGVSFQLEARTPRWMPDATAGYGYEIMIVTPRPDPWPLLPISWFVQMEILKDIDVPGRVRDGKGLTVEGVKIGNGERTADFLVEPARPPFPERCELPNGAVQLYVATRITRNETQFALKNGRPALSEKLKAAGVRQVSDLNRRSVA